jgi:hypothetical protein
MTMKEVLDTALLGPLITMGTRILHFLPNLLGAIVILAIGWPVAWAIGRGVERGMAGVGIEHLAQRFGINDVIARFGVTPDLCRFTGRMLYWGLLALVLIASLGALDVTPLNQFAATLLGYVPHLMIAALILIAGMFLSNFVARATLIAAVNANFSAATTAAGLARWSVLLVALAMALEQLGIAQNIVVVGFGIIMGSMALAVAIALGLGAKDLAKDFLERWLAHRSSDRTTDDLRHV